MGDDKVLETTKEIHKDIGMDFNKKRYVEEGLGFGYVITEDENGKRELYKINTTTKQYSNFCSPIFSKVELTPESLEHFLKQFDFGPGLEEVMAGAETGEYEVNTHGSDIKVMKGPEIKVTKLNIMMMKKSQFEKEIKDYTEMCGSEYRA